MAKILVEYGARLKIQEKTGASQPTIRKALAGKTDTQLALSGQRQLMNLAEQSSIRKKL